MDLALEADRAGFTAVSLTEHHMFENQGYQNSLLFACALAPQLSQAAIVLATVNPALHHPVRLVESCNLIDQLNAGRLIVGFGLGYRNTDFAVFGRDFEDRARLFKESLTAVLDIWNFDGSHGALEFTCGADSGRIDAPINPSSLRRPHPILARATFNDASMLETAALGWPVLTAGQDPVQLRARMKSYDEALESFEHDAATIALARAWSSVAHAMHVAETDAQAEAEVDAYFQRNPTGAIARRREDVICGSPDTMVGILEAYGRAGVGLMICALLLDLHDRAAHRRSLDLMKSEVLPRLGD